MTPHSVVPKGFYELIFAEYLAQCLVASTCFINFTHFLHNVTLHKRYSSLGDANISLYHDFSSFEAYEED